MTQPNESTINGADFRVPASGRVSHERIQAFGRAERHSRVVRRLKLLLPLTALTIASVFFAYSYVLPPEGVSAGAESAAFSEGKLVMANPKLEGFTKDNKPYLMTATRATQDFDQQGIVDLERISARMPIEADNWAQVEADSGIYDRTANTIQLNTNVRVTTTNGMVAKLQAAFLDIDKGMLKSDDPVDIQMKGSRITSDAMTVLENGRVVVFDRRVRMNIDAGQVKSAQQQGSGGTNASN